MGQSEDQALSWVRIIAVNAITVSSYVLSGGNHWVSAAVYLGASYLFQPSLPEESFRQTPQNQSPSTNPDLRNSGRANAFGVVPKVYGRHILYPKIISNPFIFNDNGVIKEVAIFDFGLGKMELEKLRIGETPIENFRGINLRFVDPNRGTDFLRYVYPPFITEFENGDNTLQQNFSDFVRILKTITFQNDELTQTLITEAPTVRRATRNIVRKNQLAVLNFVFPNGIFSGTEQAGSIVFAIEYKSYNPADSSKGTLYQNSIYPLLGENDQVLIDRRSTYSNLSGGKPNWRGSVTDPSVPDQSHVKDFGQNYMPLRSPTGFHADHETQLLMLPFAHKLGTTGADQSDAATPSNRYYRKVNVEAGLRETGIGILENVDLSKYSDYKFLSEDYKNAIAKETDQNSPNFGKPLIYGYPKGTQEIDVHHGLVIRPGQYPSHHLFWNNDRSGTPRVNQPINHFKIKKGAWLMLAPPQLRQPENDKNQLRLPTNTRILNFGSILGFIESIRMPSDFTLNQPSLDRPGKNKCRIRLTKPLERDEPVFLIIKDPTIGNENQALQSGSLNAERIQLGLRGWRDSLKNGRIAPFNGKGDPDNLSRAVPIENSEPFVPLFICNPDPTHAIVAGSQADPVRSASIPIKLPDYDPNRLNDYEFRIRRATEFETSPADNQGETFIDSIQSYFDGSGIITKTDKRHLFLQLTFVRDLENGISSVPTDLNAIVKSFLYTNEAETPTGDTWLNKVSSNPAWILHDLLRYEINKEPLSGTDIDYDSFFTFSKFCNKMINMETNLKMNFVIDYETTVSEIVRQLLGACRAGLRIKDGRVSVYLDDRTEDIKQLFTPRNSNGFVCNKLFAKKVTGTKCTFFDETAGFLPGIVRTYKEEGNDSSNLIDVTCFGTTTPGQAARLGKYLNAQSEFRSEIYKLNTDFENLLCNIGDRVAIAFEQIKGGGFPLRIKSVLKSVDPDPLYTVTFDDDVNTDAGENTLILRTEKAQGTRVLKITNLTIIDTFRVSFKRSDIQNVNSQVPVPNDFTPSVDDLCVIGKTGKTIIDCIVKRISARDELQAEIELVAYNDEIYNAVENDYIPDYTPTFSDKGKIPSNLVFVQISAGGPYCDSGMAKRRVRIHWARPLSGVVTGYRVEVAVAGQRTMAFDIQDGVLEKAIVIDASANSVHASVFPYYEDDQGTRHRAVGFVPSTAWFKNDTNPLSYTTFFEQVVSGQTLSLNWGVSGDCVNDGVSIRFSEDDGGWKDAGHFRRVAKGQNSLSNLPVIQGWYYIKAIDLNGLEELEARKVFVNDFEKDFITVETLTASPDFKGPKDDMVIDNGELRLAHRVRSGVYAFDDSFKDLGFVFEKLRVRLISTFGQVKRKIVMEDWDSLSELETLDTEFPGTHYYEKSVAVKTGNHQTIRELMTALKAGTEPTSPIDLELENVRYLSFYALMRTLKKGISPALATLQAELKFQFRHEVHTFTTDGVDSDITIPFHFKFFRVDSIALSSDQSLNLREISRSKSSVHVSYLDGSRPPRASINVSVTISGYGKGI